MKIENIDSLIVNSTNFACYIADKESYDIIYVNNSIKELFKPAYGDNFEYKGKKCYKIFQNLDAPCPHCANETLLPDQIIHRQMFVELTQKNYILVDSLIEVEGRMQRLTVAYDNSSKHPVSENTQDEIFFLKHGKEYLALLDATPFCMNLLNMTTQARICNQKVLEVFNLPDRKTYSDQFYKLSPKYQPDGRTSEQAAFDFIEQARREGSIKFKWLHCDLEGNEIPTELELKKLDLLDEEGQPYFACYFKDLRSELAGSNEDSLDGYFYDTISSKTLFNSVADMVEGWYFSFDLRTSNIQFYGKGKEKLNLPSGKRLYPDSFDIAALVHKDDLDLFYTHLELIRKGIQESWEVRFLLPTGEYRYFRTVYKIIKAKDGKPLFCVGRTFDVHEEKMLEILSQTDQLTSCFNKITTENLIQNALDKHKDSSHTMFIFDIDNFKSINDALGHQSGDSVLSELSKNLHNVFRENDIIGRMGGDEFVIFLQNISDIDLIISKAESIMTAFKNTRIPENPERTFSASIGISLYPLDGSNYKELYQSADKALYQSKLRGKDCYSFFSEKKFFNTSHISALDNANRVVNTYIDSDFVNNVFDIMHKAKDLSSSMYTVLQYISEKFSVQRAYIYEIKDDKKIYALTYEYYEESRTPSDKALSEIAREAFSDFFDELYAKGLLFYNDFELEENQELYQSLKKQGIKNFLLLQVQGEEFPEIILGLDDCKANRYWNEKQINSLRYLIKLLSIFLVFSKKNI